MYQTNPPLEEVLEHHGIQGQKWGVRRFQNKDGSYTSAGLKRYGIVERPDSPESKILKKWQERDQEERQAKAIARELDSINRRRYAKASKERDKLADDADRKSKYYSDQAKSAKNEYDALKKEGESNFVKRQKSYMDYEMSDDDIEALFGMNLKTYYKEELSRLEKTQKSSIETGKAYLKYRDDLMNMDISMASKKDVSKQAKRLLNNALNSVNDEDEDDGK